MTIMLDDGPIEVSLEEILGAYHAAANQIEAQARLRQIAATGRTDTDAQLPIYRVDDRGQLFALAYKHRGDPINGAPVHQYRLNFGNLEMTMRQSHEPSVHIGSTVGDTYPPSHPEYKKLRTAGNGGAGAVGEATRLIRLMKVKEVPAGNSYNNTMVPIMTISETDRSRIGGLLAMTELYNVKYGSRSFDQAFDNNGDPGFVGAKKLEKKGKKAGGAKALKRIDRERLNPAQPGADMEGYQRVSLHNSVETFVTHLATPRGKRNGRSKFAGLERKDQVLAKLTETLVRRAGSLQAQPVAGAAPVAAAAPGAAREAMTKIRGGVGKRPAHVAKQRVRRAAALNAAGAIKKLANPRNRIRRR